MTTHTVPPTADKFTYVIPLPSALRPEWSEQSYMDHSPERRDLAILQHGVDITLNSAHAGVSIVQETEIDPHEIRIGAPCVALAVGNDIATVSPDEAEAIAAALTAAAIRVRALLEQDTIR